MRYSRFGGLGCGGVIMRGLLVSMLGIVALICIANRSWFEAKAIDAMYGERARIHQGEQFKPGAVVTEDGVRQTAVLVKGVPHVRVTSPTEEWRDEHKDAECERDVCTAPATKLSPLPGGATGGVTGLLAALLMIYVVWTLLMGDDSGHSSPRRHGGRGRRPGRRSHDDDFDW
jgi:hypothetical protein